MGILYLEEENGVIEVTQVSLSSNASGNAHQGCCAVLNGLNCQADIVSQIPNTLVTA